MAAPLRRVFEPAALEYAARRLGRTTAEELSWCPAAGVHRADGVLEGREVEHLRHLQAAGVGDALLERGEARGLLGGRNQAVMRQEWPHVAEALGRIGAVHLDVLQ